MAMIVLIFETGNLILIRAIGTHLHGEITGMMLGWVYALLFAPIVFVFWNFESLVAFFLLLGIYYILKKRDIRGGLAIGSGRIDQIHPRFDIWCSVSVLSTESHYQISPRGGWIVRAGVCCTLFQCTIE